MADTDEKIVEAMDTDSTTCPGDGTTDNKQIPEDDKLPDTDNPITEPKISDFKKPVFQQPKSDSKTHVKTKTQIEKKIIADEVNTSDEQNKAEKLSKLSPAEQLKQNSSIVPYKEPSWGGVPEEEYSFEVLKNGVIIDTVKLQKSYYVFGRLPSCDITLEHPSLSRYHAVVQYCKCPTEDKEKGWYLYDMDSTHGTWINKYKTYAKKYYRLHVGHVVKFGGSSRLHILQGPEVDQEQESELSVTELVKQRAIQKREAEILRLAEQDIVEKKRADMVKNMESDGCSWGMDEFEEEEEEGEGENEFASILTQESEALYIDDPKKALKGFFEREGCGEPEYNVDDVSKGKFKCTVELPLDLPNGMPMVAEAIVSGKKKEAVIQCALEACRMLDRQGVLRASKHESHKKKKKNWEDDDFYDSDEDSFLDRTGDIEKKRQKRMQQAGKLKDEAQTYDNLVEKHNAVLKEIQSLQSQLDQAKAKAAAFQEEEADALDAYMSAIKSGMMDTKTKMKLRIQLMELTREEQKLRKLVNIAKPASLPPLQPAKPASHSVEDKPAPSGRPSSMVGKVKAMSGHKVPKKFLTVSTKPKEDNSEEFHAEEDEDDDSEKVKVKPNINETIESIEKQNTVQDNLSDRLSDERTEKSEKEIKNNKVRKESVEVSKKDKNSTVEEFEQTLQTIIESEKCSIDNNKTEKPSNETVTVDAGKEKPEQDKKPVKRKHPQAMLYDQVKKAMQEEEDKLTSDPNYAAWLPPKNQTGDGKTHLNAKYGY